VVERLAGGTLRGGELRQGAGRKRNVAIGTPGVTVVALEHLRFLPPQTPHPFSPHTKGGRARTGTPLFSGERRDPPIAPRVPVPRAWAFSLGRWGPIVHSGESYLFSATAANPKRRPLPSSIERLVDPQGSDFGIYTRALPSHYDGGVPRYFIQLSLWTSLITAAMLSGTLGLLAPYRVGSAHQPETSLSKSAIRAGSGSM
jgi:hypothetical protein